MFSNPFQNNNINDLQNQLEMMKRNQQLMPNSRLGGAFGKLQDFIQNTSKEKVDYANSNEEVISKYNQMQNVFILFLLESSRSQFEMWCNDRGINVINDYVNTFINKTDEYVDQKTNDKIKELEEQVLSLKQKLGEV